MVNKKPEKEREKPCVYEGKNERNNDEGKKIDVFPNYVFKANVVLKRYGINCR